MCEKAGMIEWDTLYKVDTIIKTSLDPDQAL